MHKHGKITHVSPKDWSFGLVFFFKGEGESGES